MADAQSAVQQALKAFRDHDNAKFMSLFWTPLTYLFTTSRLNTIYKFTDHMFGPLESWTQPEIHKPGRIAVYKTMCKFQRGHQPLTVSVWGNRLMGIGIGTPFDLDFIPPWSPASYVDTASFSEQSISLRPFWFQPGISGSLCSPPTNTRKPAVLMLTGSGPADRDSAFWALKPFRDIAHGLASSEIVTLRMDKPTLLMALKSYVTTSLTLQDEYITPGIAALRCLSTHPSVDPTQIFILGHSLGGMVAPRLAAASPVPIAGVISLASPVHGLAYVMGQQARYANKHFPRAAQDQYAKEVKQLEELDRVVKLGGVPKGEKDPTKELPVSVPLGYLVDIEKLDPVGTAKGLHKPVLVGSGESDWQVSGEEYQLWLEGIRGASGFRQRRWEGMGHQLCRVDEDKYGSFQYDEPRHVDEHVIKDLVAFVKDVCEGRLKCEAS